MSELPAWSISEPQSIFTYSNLNKRFNRDRTIEVFWKDILWVDLVVIRLFIQQSRSHSFQLSFLFRQRSQWAIVLNGFINCNTERFDWWTIHWKLLDPVGNLQIQCVRFMICSLKYPHLSQKYVWLYKSCEDPINSLSNMAVILETLSVKKLLALGVCIIAILFTFFYIGATKGKEFNTFKARISTVIELNLTYSL